VVIGSGFRRMKLIDHHSEGNGHYGQHLGLTDLFDRAVRSRQERFHKRKRDGRARAAKDGSAIDGGLFHRRAFRFFDFDDWSLVIVVRVWHLEIMSSYQTFARRLTICRFFSKKLSDLRL
jgi:hypothetical protein